MVNVRKAVMIGCGFVGSASVFSLMQSGLFSEIAMIDADVAKAEGEAAIIKNVFKAMKESEIDDNMLALKSMEALEKIAESDSTKLVLPSDTVNFLGSFKGIKEVLSNDKLQNK